MVEKKGKDSLDEGFFDELNFGEQPSTGSPSPSEPSDQISSDDKSQEAFTSEDSPKSSDKKKLLLPVILLIVLGGYAAYVYVVPHYFTKKAPAVKVRIAKKVAVKPPPKPAPQAKKPQEAVGESKAAVKAEEGLKEEKEEAPHPAKVEAGEDTGKEAPQKEEIETAEIKAAISNRPLPARPSVDIERDIKIVKTTLPVSGESGYFVQSGAFIFRGNVEAMKGKVEAAGYSPRIEAGSRAVNMNRLLVGDRDDIETAKETVRSLRKEGYEATVLDLGSGQYTVLAGSYYYGNIAQEEKIILETRGFDARIVKTPIEMKIYHLLLGPFESAEEAAKVDSDLKGRGLETAILRTP